MRKDRKEQFGFGNAGWVRYEQDQPPLKAWVRFADLDGRLVAVDLFFSSDAGLDTNTIRGFRIARIEALVNDPEQATWVRERMDLPGPDLREAAALYATTFGKQRRAREVDLTVKIPPSRRYPDDFYREVAKRYSAAAGKSRSPAVSIAEANGVPVATVHRWISETRRRGFLGAAQPGKAG